MLSQSEEEERRLAKVTEAAADRHAYGWMDRVTCPFDHKKKNAR